MVHLLLLCERRRHQACKATQRGANRCSTAASGTMFSKISYNVTIPHGKTYKSTALVVESAVTEHICEDRNFLKMRCTRCVSYSSCAMEDCQIECSMRLDCIAIVFNKYSNECFLKKEQGDAIETNDDLKAMPSIKNITEAFKQALDHSQENGQGDPTQVDCYGGSYANDLPGGKCPRDDHNEYSGDYTWHDTYLNHPPVCPNEYTAWSIKCTNSNEIFAGWGQKLDISKCLPSYTKSGVITSAKCTAESLHRVVATKGIRTSV